MSDEEAGGEENGEQMDLDSLQSRVEELEAELVATRKRAERAKKGFKRKSITKPARAEEEDDTTRAKAQKALEARVRLSRRVIEAELTARSDVALEVLNRVILRLDKSSRAALRLLGAMQQEKFLGAMFAVNTLVEQCYNASNTLDLRANEALPHFLIRRIVERLMTKNISGNLMRVIIMEALSYAGEGNPLTQRSNREQGHLGQCEGSSASRDDR